MAPSSGLRALGPLPLTILVGYCFAVAKTLPTGTNATTSQDASLQLQGWTQDPDGRGSLSIIWSCVATMSLCSWSLLCLNIPSPSDTRRWIFWRRLCLTAICIMGPEFILFLALTQWLSARKSVQAFKSLRGEGDREWTTKKAFYADMGGYVISTGDGQKFPIDAEQLRFLVTEGFIEYPKTSIRDIDDKNKVDGLLRFITIFQVLWFMINVIARWIQDLLVTTLELTTVAFVICSFFTIFFWANKPADVGTAEHISTTATVTEIQQRASFSTVEHYTRTPLDCISWHEWHASLYVANLLNTLKRLHIDFRPKTKPVDHFENTRMIDPGDLSLSQFGYWIFTMAYFALFTIAWNDVFPTSIEHLLWRVATGGLLVTSFLYVPVTLFAFNWYPNLKRRLESQSSGRVTHQPAASSRTSRVRKRIRGVADAIRNNDKDKDPALTVPLKAMLLMYLLPGIYMLCRAYILLEDILQFRSLPASAFATVDWTKFLPHVD